MPLTSHVSANAASRNGYARAIGNLFDLLTAAKGLLA